MAAISHSEGQRSTDRECREGTPGTVKSLFELKRETSPPVAKDARKRSKVSGSPESAVSQSAEIDASTSSHSKGKATVDVPRAGPGRTGRRTVPWKREIFLDAFELGPTGWQKADNQ